MLCCWVLCVNVLFEIYLWQRVLLLEIVMLCQFTKSELEPGDCESLVEPLFIRMQTVNTTFNLWAWSSPFKLQFSTVHHWPQNGQWPSSNILACMAKSRDEIWQEPQHRTFIHNVAWDTLSHFDGVSVFVEITFHCADSCIFSFHCLKASHASVFLEPKTKGEIKVYHKVCRFKNSAASILMRKVR